MTLIIPTVLKHHLDVRLYGMICNSIIYAANNVAKEIDPATSDATEQYFLSQGLGARAFSYWVLAQLFQFNYKGNESKPCVPLITDKNMEAAADNGCPRSTVQDVYTQITTDLTTAVDLLKKAESAGEERKDKRYISLAVALWITGSCLLVYA